MANLVNVNLSVPKELNDVRVALLAVVSDLLAGKDAAAVVLGNIQNLSEAIGNAQAIPEEFKQNLKESAALSGLMGGELIGLVLAPKSKAGDIV
jgi:hypothetical protein